MHGANELKESSSKREVYAVRLGEPVELRPALQNAVKTPPTRAHVSITRCFYYCTVLLLYVCPHTVVYYVELWRTFQSAADPRAGRSSALTGASYLASSYLILLDM